ncbi:hypothetical protein BLNAU_24906 [Blattamonas nauphoetae]|uniref:Uncharacterized protein n=1 Tax=Blattamonas nauphoetae TaxID=2049346 RepID=A0ABQ9WL48_9EUKA|nr:hypothetical protein BLNAU_24906 [Blattamonas nauphoetae]
MMECRDAERMIRQEFVACLGDTLFQVEGITQPVLKSLGGSTLSKNDAQIMMSFVMSFGRSVIENVVIHVDEETDAKDEKTTDKSQILTRTENLVSRLISREIDIGVTAFITETTPLRKEGKEKRRNDAQASSSPFGSPPVPTPTSMLTPSPPSPLSKLTLPPSPFNKSFYAFHSHLDPTVGRTIASFSDSRWKDVLSYRTFPSCGKLNVALSRPLLSCSAGTLVISPSSFTATDQSQLTVPLVCSSPLSPSASNSATDQMRIEMEEVEFSNLNVDGSVDGVVQIEGADSLRLKKVDFSNVKNGASDAVRIFVMGAGPLSFST